MSEVKKDVALALLGLSDENPTDDEVNAAYKAAMQMNHPDRYASNERLRKHAEEQSKLINEAREVLLNGTWEHDFGRARSCDSSRTARGYARPEEDAASGDPWRHSEGESAKDGTEPKGSSRSENSQQRPAQNDDSSRRARQDGSGAVDSVPAPSFLDGWVTPIGASVAGYLASRLISALIDAVPTEALGVAIVADIVRRALFIVYALMFYPSLFTADPKARSNAVVAFLNFAVGNIIFGALWNSNLTKRSKGKSHIVFSVLVGLGTASYLVVFAMALLRS